MARRTLVGKRILVTGASQGIGYAFAREAARRGARVMAVARSAEPLQILVEEVGRTYLPPHVQESLLERLAVLEK